MWFFFDCLGMSEISPEKRLGDRRAFWGAWAVRKRRWRERRAFRFGPWPKAGTLTL